MEIYHAITLGIIEGLTEYLPISSTGHLMLFSRVLGLRPDDFLKSFEISIQLGAILGVVALYGKSFFTDANITKKVIVAFIPTGIVGFLFYKVIKSFLLESTDTVLWSLFLGGVLLIVFERWHKEKENSIIELSDISYRQSFWIGVAQSISIVPGVSRAAATIVGGLLAGISRKTIVEFSFLLALPTMLAASGFDLWKHAGDFSSENFGMLAVGFVVSFVVAILSMKFFLWYIKNHSFMAFGIYRIVAAVFFWFFLY